MPDRDEIKINELRQERERILERAKKIENFFALYEELVEDENNKNFHSKTTSSVNSVPAPVSEAKNENGLNGKRIDQTNHIRWNRNWTMKEKVKRLLVEAGKFSHIQELAKIALAHGEPEYEKGLKMSLQERISAAFTSYGKDVKRSGAKEVVKKIQIGPSNRAFVWGLAEWMEGEEIKQEYMYNDEYFNSIKMELFNKKTTEVSQL